MNQKKKLQYEQLPVGSQDDLLAQASIKKGFGGLPDDEDDLASQTQLSSRALTNKPIMTPLKQEKGLCELLPKRTEENVEDDKSIRNKSIAITQSKGGGLGMQNSDNSSSAKKQQYMMREAEGSEQKETRAKGQRMEGIIEMQIEAQYQKSVNKIMGGSYRNLTGYLGNKKSQKKIDPSRVSKFNDDENQSLRQSQSFNIRPERIHQSSMENLDNMSAFSTPFIQAENQNGGRVDNSIIDQNEINLNFNQSSNLPEKNRSITIPMGRPPLSKQGAQQNSPDGIVERQTSHILQGTQPFSNFQFSKEAVFKSQQLAFPNQQSHNSSLGSINRADIEDYPNQQMRSQALNLSRQNSFPQKSTTTIHYPRDPGAPFTHKAGGYVEKPDEDQERFQEVYYKQELQFDKSNFQKSQPEQQLQFSPDFQQEQYFKGSIMNSLKQSPKEVKSILSGPSYKSDEIFHSIQIDEQISTHEQYIEKLKNIKKMQEEQGFGLNSNRLSNFNTNQSNFGIEVSNGEVASASKQPLIFSAAPGHQFGTLAGKSDLDELFVNKISQSPNKIGFSEICNKPQQVKGRHIQFNIEQVDAQITQRCEKSENQSPNLFKKLSRLEIIKQEKKEKTLNERLIRQFNMKLFEKVVNELKDFELPMGSIVEEQQASHSSDDQEQQDANRLGVFLYNAKGIDKQMSGFYFGEDKRFNQKVCREFMGCFNFKNLPVDSCWRLIFNKCGLPKEGQQITRMMEVFQDVYLQQNEDKKVEWQDFPDTVWLLSVKLLDLNTNLHNPNVKPMLRYSKETFVEQSMKFPELKNAFTEQQISDMYDRIQRYEFENKVSLHEKYLKRINELSYSLVQHGIDKNNYETISNASKQVSQSGQWRASGSKTISKKSQKKIQENLLNEKKMIFKEQGTIFTKYGRYGDPKQRMVYLNENESAILWRDRLNPNDKPRKMLIKEMETVMIGSDHTPVMRKQKIPMQFDNYCISIIGQDRSLDLMIQDKKVLQLWSEKIRQLIEAEKHQQNRSPESPQKDNVSQELQINERDQCPECIEYTWKVEILNNFQKYWNPMKKEINYEVEIHFADPQLKLAVLNLMHQNGFFMHLTQEEREKKPQSFHAASRKTLIFPNNKNASCTGIGSIFSSEKEALKEKFKNMFDKKEALITLDQLWYLGLSNMARNCLWPILIGNSLNLSPIVYESVNLQAQAIKEKMVQKQPRHSHLSSIVSEREKENNSSILDADPRDYLGFEDFKIKKVQSNGTAHFPTTPGGEYPQPPLLDIFTEQMILQFYKINRKVTKLVNHWEQASVIGELAEIPVEIFQSIMSDVLCTFVIHKANINGVQSAISNMGKHQEPQNIESANYVSGMEKVLAPLVLIHLRESDFSEPEKLTSQIFVSFSNLMLGGFLKHFITDDIAQIEWRMDFFDKFFERVLPQLHRQFRGINLKCEFFLHGWLMDMFVNVQGLEGLEFVLKIWDIYLLHGEAILYCVAIAILKSKLHKLNNAPMQNWLDFFSRIKKLKLPSQSQYYHINAGFQENQGGSGQSLYQGGSDVTNMSSKMLIPLMQDIIKIYIDFNAQALFQEHELQQIIAEQKNEIFTKVYFNDI